RSFSRGRKGLPNGLDTRCGFCRWGRNTLNLARRRRWRCFNGRRTVMGASRDDFVKYPRTPHLFGSKGTDDDKHLGEAESVEFIADKSLIVEEKIDGTNVGIHFTSAGQMVLQCRGHLISQGMHPQYDLFKQWTAVKRGVIEERLEDRYILF